MKSKWTLCLCILVASLLAGCINYEEEIDLNANGGGKMLMHYSIPQQLAAMMAMGQSAGEKKEEMPFKFKEEEIKADLAAPGVTVDKFEMKTEGDKQHFYVHLSFDQITNLNQTNTFKEMPFDWKKDGKTVTFQQTLKGKSGPGSEGDQAADQMANAMLGNASFKFKVRLPSKAMPSPDTNGTIVEDGKTVTWEYPLMELGKGDKVMIAKFETGGLSMTKLILFGSAGLISLVTLVVVVSIARKM